MNYVVNAPIKFDFSRINVCLVVVYKGPPASYTDGRTLLKLIIKLDQIRV